MARYEYGERIARTAQLITGTSAFILDSTGSKVLLTRRTDNGRWCLPSGAMEAGESAEECCIREVWEETTLEVRVTRLIGIYSNPHRITTYADGNRWHVISFSFAAEIISGEPGLSNETTEVGFFTPTEFEQMDIIDSHRERITDALSNQVAAYFK
jgi:ADP-ribose pyrophosphatase YjhB (NUDIX family)